MLYKDFGKTGIKISKLGFGSMRLPMKNIDGKNVVEEEKSIDMIQRAFEEGVNYIDTALFYCDGLSEIVVGKALQGWRDRVYLSTKYPVGNEKGYREVLETQLTKLQTNHIDFYHFHGIGRWFLKHEKRDQFIKEALQAKDEGLIKHISFSFHDEPSAMAEIIDLGIFSSVLSQYNLLDRANADAIANAKAKGLGTVVMGPVGGGRIAGMDREQAEKLGVKVRSSAELALRFVFSNPNVDCALSGMGNMNMVLENIAVASRVDALSKQELADVQAALEENKRLAELYCTGCNYCVPHCPQEVNIPRIFQAMNYYRIYGLKDFARGHYNEIGRDWAKGAKADACIECGECEQYCPQHISIREQLKECLETFGE